MAGKLKSTIEELAHEFAIAIEREVRADMMRRLSGEEDTTVEPTRVLADSPSVVAIAPRARKNKAPKTPSGRNYPQHCIYPGCKNPHRGPGSGFFCAEHLSISQQEKAKIKAERISTQAKAFLLGK